MNKNQIKHMVDRFLSWKLPKNFAPDCGIQFDADGAKKLNPRNARYEPSGTNLLDATQAEAMVRFMVEGMPDDAAERELAEAKAQARTPGTTERCDSCRCEIKDGKRHRRNSSLLGYAPEFTECQDFNCPLRSPSPSPGHSGAASTPDPIAECVKAALDECSPLTDADVRAMALWIKERLPSPSPGQNTP